MLNNYEVLNKKAKWTHYLWSNYPSLIPETVKLFQARGVKVMDYHNLPSTNDHILKLEKKALNYNIVTLTDLIRFQVL